MKDEYARVGVPMMPVVHGEAETRRQILLYTLPARRRSRCCRWRSASSARSTPSRRVVLGGVFLVPRVRLQRRADRRAALRTYLFSLAYLALLFVRDGGRRPARRIGAPMDRKLARRNIRTGLIVSTIMLLMFGLTFLAAAIYTA